MQVLLPQMASENLSWKWEESRFPLCGRLHFSQPTEANWKRPWTGKMSAVNAFLVVQAGQELPEVVPETFATVFKKGMSPRDEEEVDNKAKDLIFPSSTNGVKDAYLVLFREKSNSKPPAMARVSTAETVFHVSREVTT